MPLHIPDQITAAQRRLVFQRRSTDAQIFASWIDALIVGLILAAVYGVWSFLDDVAIWWVG